MGKIKKGILGGFSGKTGTVVGANWKQIDYMRSLPSHMHNPKTQKQLEQRAKFKLMMAFLQPLNGFLNAGFKLQAKKQSPINAAMQYNVKNGIAGVYPDYTIDVEKILVARGSLPNADALTAVAITDGKVKFDWEFEQSMNAAMPNDYAQVVMLNTTKNAVDYYMGEAMRSEQTLSLIVPSAWIGNTVETYFTFISEDRKQVANSVHKGPIVIIA